MYLTSGFVSRVFIGVIIARAAIIPWCASLSYSKLSQNTDIPGERGIPAIIGLNILYEASCRRTCSL